MSLARKAEIAKNYRLRNKEAVNRRIYESRLYKRYNLTIKDYEVLVTSQKGYCKICKRVPNKKLCVDHDHSTGVVRGLLCNTCNAAIGFLREDYSTFIRAILYLSKSSKEFLSSEIINGL